jgi:hypothetical protein
MPDLSYSFLDYLLVIKWFSVVLSVVNVTLALVFLNILVINLVSLPMYVNLTHLVLSISCFCFFLRFTFFRVEASYFLLVKICCIVLFSFYIPSSDNLYVFIL